MEEDELEELLFPLELELEELVLPELELLLELELEELELLEDSVAGSLIQPVNALVIKSIRQVVFTPNL